ncbi:MAG TPA: crosslink repair DNA glycosylase YcaQ family protein [Gaiellaceae bacterium]|nr:crosslink repair DNA glycosylase YcaQ family protein [Gaiellaceae bacterium]
MPAPLRVTREQICAFRRRVGGLDARVPLSAESLRRAAWAGLQDSMPRAALLSLHARIQGVKHSTWEHPSLAQLWGPRYSVYVVAKKDFALFSLGRLPDDAKGRERAERMAARMRVVLAGNAERVPDREVAQALGVHNAIRYAAPTGTIAIRWEGARAPLIWTVPAPKVEPAVATRELARRYLHVFGPTNASSFTRWAGISKRAGAQAFAELEPELIPVRTPVGDELLLAPDEAELRAADATPAPARLLPSGDAYYLLDGAERDVLVPRADRRARLWTSRVWPGALLVDGEIRGTWRRAQHKLQIETWTRLTPAQRAAVEGEAATLPLPGLDRAIDVAWDAG